MEPALGEIKRSEFIVILMDFPYTNALFRLIIHHDP